MNDVITRYKTVLSETQCDRQTAATLVLAERLNLLVNAMLNVDATVTRIDQAAIRNTPVDIPAEVTKLVQAGTLTNDEAAIKHIREQYVER